MNAQNVSSIAMVGSGRLLRPTKGPEHHKTICRTQAVDEFELTLSSNGPPTTVRDTHWAIPCSCTPKVREAMSRAIPTSTNNGILHQLPTTSPLPIHCCRICVVASDYVEIFYWPPEKNSTKSSDPHRNAMLTDAPISSVVSNGFTFISPSVYVSYVNIKATASCAVTWRRKNGDKFEFGGHYNAMIAYDSKDLSTAACSNGTPLIAGSLPGRTWFKPETINFEDYESRRSSQLQCASAILPDSKEIKGPLLFLPKHLTELDPLWNWCRPAYGPNRDPPRALTHEGSLPLGPEKGKDESPAPQITPALPDFDQGHAANSARPALAPPTPRPTVSTKEPSSAPHNGKSSNQESTNPEVLGMKEIEGKGAVSHKDTEATSEHFHMNQQSGVDKSPQNSGQGSGHSQSKDEKGIDSPQNKNDELVDPSTSPSGMEGPPPPHIIANGHTIERLLGSAHPARPNSPAIAHFQSPAEEESTADGLVNNIGDRPSDDQGKQQLGADSQSPGHGDDNSIPAAKGSAGDDTGGGQSGYVLVDGHSYSIGAHTNLPQGQPLSIASDYVLLGSSSFALPPAAQASPEPTSQYSQQRAHSLITLANAGPTISAGGAPVTMNGKAVSLDSGGSSLFVNGKAYSLPNLQATGAAAGKGEVEGGGSPITFAGQTFTPHATDFAIGSQTVKAGAPAITISGTLVSLGSDGSLLIGTRSTRLFPATGTDAGVLVPQATVGGIVLEGGFAATNNNTSTYGGNEVTPQAYAGKAAGRRDIIGSIHSALVMAYGLWIGALALPLMA